MLSSTFINGTLRENEERMNEVCLRPVDNCGHIGHTYILTNVKWK